MSTLRLALYVFVALMVAVSTWISSLPVPALPSPPASPCLKQQQSPFRNPPQPFLQRIGSGPWA